MQQVVGGWATGVKGGIVIVMQGGLCSECKGEMWGRLLKAAWGGQDRGPGVEGVEVIVAGGGGGGS